MREPDPVLIFDLDETVLTINSFPHWARFMLYGRMMARPGWRRLRAGGAVAALLAARRVRLIGHEALQWRLQRRWQAEVCRADGRGEEAGGKAAGRFVATLLPFVRPALHDLLAAVRDRRVDAVLATAAAAEYAVPLGERLGFADVLATASGRAAPCTSNVRARKRDAVLALLRQRGWQHRSRILFTDHHDDLPLMMVCQTVYWFGSDAARGRVLAAHPTLTLRPGAAAADTLAGLRRLSPPGAPATRPASLRETA